VHLSIPVTKTTFIILNTCNNMNYWVHCVAQSGKKISVIALKMRECKECVAFSNTHKKMNCRYQFFRVCLRINEDIAQTRILIC
jgi:hypothetical protein